MNKSWFFIVATLSLLGVMAIVSVVGAQSSNPRVVTEDTYWDINALPTDVNGSANIVDAQGSTSACTLTRAGLLKWDLSDLSNSASVGHVVVRLAGIVSSTGSTASTTLALFEAPDNWNESTQQSNLPTPTPITDTPLAQVTGPFTVGGDVVFDVTGVGTPLVQYVQNQIAGDQTVSFWVEITGGCPTGTGAARVTWKSREAGTSYLELYSPTSVTLTTFSANNSGAVNWSLIVGLFALGAAILVGVGYGMRRSRRQP